MSSAFLTTRWTRVLAARGSDTAAQEALRDLCAASYEPVVAFLRRSGRSADDARDLAHGFFEKIESQDSLAGADRDRGRFRSYLLGALKHYLNDRHARDHRLKRGGGIAPLPLDAPANNSNTTHDTGARGIADPHALPPDREFDRQWALQVLRRALAALESAAAADGSQSEFALLKPLLTADTGHGAIAALARSSGTPEATLRSRLHRLRREFRALVRAEVASTLSSRADLDDEMASLLTALRPRPPNNPGS